MYGRAVELSCRSARPVVSAKLPDHLGLHRAPELDKLSVLFALTEANSLHLGQERCRHLIAVAFRMSVVRFRGHFFRNIADPTNSPVEWEDKDCAVNHGRPSWTSLPATKRP